jgi:hypothetical protein
MNVYFKTLIYNGEWVDLAKISIGIYTAQAPCLIHSSVKSMEEFIQNRERLYNMVNRVMPISEVENLKKCELITIEIKKCKD